jgi:hypothetical protein
MDFHENWCETIALQPISLFLLSVTPVLWICDLAMFELKRNLISDSEIWRKILKIYATFNKPQN